MQFTQPAALEEALKLLRAKKLVPTGLGSAELRTLSAEVKNAALFSARMTQIRPLQALSKGLALMLEGAANMADAKLLLSEVYQAMRYDSEAGGFPQDAPGTMPPALRGSLRDLSSQPRMELTLRTNYSMVTNAAFVTRTTGDAQRLYEWPCYELIRIGSRVTPRGYERGKDGALKVKPGDDWPSRFLAAGGELFENGTRMIAPKGSDVWVKLGEGAGGYEDTLGNAFPPYAFGSGWGLREVSRGEALTVGVMQPEDEAAKMPVELKQKLKAQANKVPKDILNAFSDLELAEDGEWLRLAQKRQNAAEAERSLRNRVSALSGLLLHRQRISPRARCQRLVQLFTAASAS